MRKRPENMVTYNDESDEALLGYGERRPPDNGWNRPLLFAGIGLVLMLGGYAATVYIPRTFPQAEHERRLQDLRKRAAERQDDGEDDGLNQRLKQFQTPRSTPPYLFLGRLAIYGGLFLFVLAGVLMYRSTPPPDTEPRP